MAMELHVFSNRSLASTADWQRAIDIEKFPLHLAVDSNFATTRGFLPASLEGKQSGFEIFHDIASDSIESLGSENFTQAWNYALGFRWRGSSLDELLAAWMAATAYAAATDGVVFDHEEGKALTPQSARETVANIVRDIPRAAAFLAEINKKFAKEQ